MVYKEDRIWYTEKDLENRSRPPFSRIATMTMSPSRDHVDVSLPTETKIKNSPPPYPLIFLDIDGVLNKTATATHIRFEPDNMANLLSLLHQAPSDTRIVLSSFWRPFFDYVQYILGREGVESWRVVGTTRWGPSRATAEPGGAGRDAVSSAEDPAPTSSSRKLNALQTHQETHNAARRCDEIREFLAENTARTFVILDDREDAGCGLDQCFVRTDVAVGLSKRDAEKAAKILWGGTGEGTTMLSEGLC